MAYRLKADELVADGVKRVILDEIDKTEAMLRQEGEARDAGIHDARKSFKKIRAVLRLVRPDLGSTYQHENAWFRDSARDLSDLRDAQAVLESFDKLRDAFPDRMNGQGFGEIRSALERRRTRIGHNDGELVRNAERVRENLPDVRRRIAAWDLKHEGFAAIEPGLRQTYGRGRRARVKAYRSSSDEAFHDWRKRVKYHWYHVRLLQDVWAPVMKSYCRSLKDLADMLGDDHDLVVVKQILADPDLDLDDKAALGACAGLIEGRQGQLRATARRLGDRIYAEKPKCISARIGSYWRTWQGET
jgi:CHAD domain-containing protein